jgi:hypothetical protein
MYVPHAGRYISNNKESQYFVFWFERASLQYAQLLCYIVVRVYVHVCTTCKSSTFLWDSQAGSYRARDFTFLYFPTTAYDASRCESPADYRLCSYTTV